MPAIALRDRYSSNPLVLSVDIEKPENLASIPYLSTRKTEALMLLSSLAEMVRVSTFIYVFAINLLNSASLPWTT